MIRFALDKNNNRIYIDDIKPDTGTVICECCGEPLIARRGTIMAHHFAHKPNSICSAMYYENVMSEWHKNWQDVFPIETQEIWSPDKKHRADVLLEDEKIVIEFQHSRMDCDTFTNRTLYWINAGYKIIWIFDGENLDIDINFNYDWYNYAELWTNKFECYYINLDKMEIHIDTYDGIYQITEEIPDRYHKYYYNGDYGYDCISSYFEICEETKQYKSTADIKTDWNNYIKTIEPDYKSEFVFVYKTKPRKTDLEGYYSIKQLWKMVDYDTIEIENEKHTRIRLYRDYFNQGKFCRKTFDGTWSTKGVDYTFFNADIKQWKFIRGFYRD